MSAQKKKPRPLWRQLLDRLLWVVVATLCYVLMEILMPVWPCPYPHWDRQVATTRRNIKTIEKLAYSFRQARRRYPVSLAQLAERAAEFISASTFNDGWGRSFIYESPGRINTHAFDLYSKGQNGIGDDGRHDDITNWSERDPSYYNKDHHRGWLNSTIFDGTAAFVLGWLVWSLVRWRRRYFLVARKGWLELRAQPLPVWLGPALAVVAATAVFLSYPVLKAEYYSWRWAYLMSYPRLESERRYWRLTGLLPRPPGAPHSNTDDAAETLIYMGPSAAPVVAAKLNHPSLAGRSKLPVREGTVRLLGLMGDPSVVPTLRELLLLQGPEDPRYVRHMVVAQALRRLGDRSALWLLLEDITRRQGVTTFWSAKALELLTWQSFGDLRPDLPAEEARRRVALWSEWWRQNQEREESEWLRQGVEQALGQLTSDDVYLQASAIRRLRRVTGMRFFCEYYMSLPERRKAAQVWRHWWLEHQQRFRHASFDSIDHHFRTVASLYVIEW